MPQVGSTRQRVNQVLHEWEAKKIVKVARGSVVVVRPDKLQAYIAEP